MIIIIYKLGISSQNLNHIFVCPFVHPSFRIFSITQNMNWNFFYFMFAGILLGFFSLILVFLQQIEMWKESEDGVLDISIKLYVKKDTHMVSSLIPPMFSESKKQNKTKCHLFRKTSFPCCCFTIIGPYGRHFVE